MKKFIQCGFEFTASLKEKEKLKSKTLEVNTGSSYVYRAYEDYLNPYTNRMDRRRRRKVSDIKWINEKYDSDDCGCEVPTPIIKSKKDAITHFNQFKSFVDENNLTIDLHQAQCCLGGCHIHLGLKTIPENQRSLFIKNIAVLLTNYPQLNWAFNDPNDNENANSLLMDLTKDNDRVYGVSDYSASMPSERRQIETEKFREDKSLLRFILTHGTDVNAYKKFSFRYNQNYNTVELRIFDMPKNLKQHILHSDVAQAIYHYCLDKANKKILDTVEYSNQDEYQVSLAESKVRFKKVMKLLKINPSRTRHQMKIMELRYDWNKIQTQEDYLL